MTGPDQRGRARTAALATAPLTDVFPAPEYVPDEWFKPDLTWLHEWRAQYADPADPFGSMRLVVTDEGRAGGMFFEAGVCLVESGDPRGSGECWQPDPSPTGYGLFHQGDAVTASGKLVRVGAIGNVGGHASPFARVDAAQRRYADPNCQLLVVKAHDLFDARGAYQGACVVGAVVPGVTYGDVALLRRSALSGDWRPMPDQWFAMNNVPHQAAAAVDYYDCVGPTLVTRPGLATIRRYAAPARVAAAGEHLGPVYLGGVGGVQLEQGEDPMHVLRLANGNTIEFDNDTTPEQLAAYQAALDGAAVHQAAPMPPGAPDTEDEPDEGNAEARLAALEAQVGELRAMVEAMAAQYDEQQRAAAQRAASAVLVPKLPQLADA